MKIIAFLKCIKMPMDVVGKVTRGKGILFPSTKHQSSRVASDISVWCALPLWWWWWWCEINVCENERSWPGSEPASTCRVDRVDGGAHDNHVVSRPSCTQHPHHDMRISSCQLPASGIFVPVYSNLSNSPINETSRPSPHGRILHSLPFGTFSSSPPAICKTRHLGDMSPRIHDPVLGTKWTQADA